MTTPIATSTTDSQMHNNIMAAGSRDRPPMLATGRYAQWRSRFLRYIDTRPNGDALRKCILTGPYTPTMVTTPAVPATENSPEIPEKTSVETVLNMTPENKAHYESEKEAIIFDIDLELEMKSTQTFECIVRQLKKCGSHREGYNKVNHSIFKMSRQTYLGVLVPIHFSRWRKPMILLHNILQNDEQMIRNNLTVATSKSMFNFFNNFSTRMGQDYVTIGSNNTNWMKSHAATRYKGKEIAKPITPPSESASEEDSDPEQAQKDKDMQKNLALILQSASKSSTNLPTPTSETPQNTKKQECGYYSKCNSRWDTVPLNCNEFGHFAKECRKPKLEQSDLASRHRMRKIDVTRFGSTLQSYMAKIQEVPNADSGTDAEPLEQVHYDTDHNVFANDLQHFEQSESISNTCVVVTGDSNVIPDSPDMCNNDIQNDQSMIYNYDERAAHC
ncbi:hypothetical protein Tco_1057717 [Tanacetum coccineum]|uniref:CCHC-type domain-containing protein n=1 Tax=Tanacetum coccineum TaxID=301880 RepID=A0ABQ5H678_9ASTR